MMKKLFFYILLLFGVLGFSQNPTAKTVKFIPQALDITSPQEGQLFYKSTDNIFYYYNGSDFVPLGSTSVTAKTQYTGFYLDTDINVNNSDYVDYINALGFTVSSGEVQYFTRLVANTDGTLRYEVRLFKNGNGVYGDDASNPITIDDLFVVNTSQIGDNDTIAEAITVDLGDIGSTAIENHINTTNDPEYNLTAGNIYFFTCTKSSVNEVYIYKGILPILMGSGNTSVSNSDFQLISQNGIAVVNIAKTITPDTGLSVNVSNPLGNDCNMLSANTADSGDTIIPTGTGGWAKILVNSASEPNVGASAVKEVGATFLPNTDMYLIIYHDPAGYKYFWSYKNTGQSTNTGSLFFETTITDSTTVFNTQKGLHTIWPFKNDTLNQKVTIEYDAYSENDVINIERRGQGTLEIVQDSTMRFRGVRDGNNRFFVNDPNSIVALYCRGNNEFSIIGNLKRGYTGAVTTLTYSDLQPSETANVSVSGTGFSENMLDPVIVGNATLNSWSYIDNNNIVLNITSSGSENDVLDIIYDNGDIFYDDDAITLTTTSSISIVIETTSTSGTWSPSTVNNSGDILRWTVSGDASGVYDANDPTINLSGNTGTAIITITSNDDLAGLTTCRFSSLAITSADVSDWTACTELWFFGNGALTEIVGTENLVNLTSIDCRANSLTVFNGSFPLITGTVKLNQNDFTTFNTSGFPNATGMDLWGMSTLTSVDVSSSTSLTSLTLSGNANMTTITGLSNLTSLTNINIANSTAMTSIDLGSNTLLNNVVLTNCSLTQSVVNNVILDLDAHGVSNGTLNYSLNANPSATETITDDVLDAYNSLVSKSWTITGATPTD